MKLLFVHDRLGSQAGAESNLYHTAAELKRRGHEVALAHGPGTGKGEADWRKVFKLCYQFNDDDTAAGAHKALSRFQPDVVYLHNHPDLPVLEVLADSSKPIVRMVHDHQLFCLRGCRYPAWSRKPCTRGLSPFCVFPCGGFAARSSGIGGADRLMRMVSYTKRKQELDLHRNFSCLVVGSDYMRTELLRNGFSNAQIETHSPVSPSDGMTQEATYSERNLIIYAGQIVRGKGVDVLLKALALVRKPYECVILGDGHHRAYCEALCHRLGLSERVKFQGYVPQSELAEYYREATVSAVSSVWPEPFGATGLEAMRCGLPVVAFDVGGIREWLQDGVNGYLAPWMDHEYFALCLEMLLEDKALARHMGSMGRMLAEQMFDFQNYIDGVEDLFHRISENAECGIKAVV